MSHLTDIQNFLAFMATRNGALVFTRMTGLLSMGNAAVDGQNNIASRISGLQREASDRFSSFKVKYTSNKGIDSCIFKSLIVHSMSRLERLRTFGSSFFHGHRGM